MIENCASAKNTTNPNRIIQVARRELSLESPTRPAALKHANNLPFIGFSPLTVVSLLLILNRGSYDEADATGKRLLSGLKPNSHR
jgi:hypothetical protein